MPRGAIWCNLETCSPLHFCRCHVSSPDSRICATGATCHLLIDLSSIQSPAYTVTMSSPNPGPLPSVARSLSRYGNWCASSHSEITPTARSGHLSLSGIISVFGATSLPHETHDQLRQIFNIFWQLFYADVTMWFAFLCSKYVLLRFPADVTPISSFSGHNTSLSLHKRHVGLDN